MQDKKYHKIRLSEAKKDYIKVLKDHLVMETLSIGIPTIPNIILGKIYYTITNALLYEIGFLAIVFGVLFLWKSLRIVPERIYNEQQDTIKSKQKKIESLEEQQKPTLRIDFDENDPNYYDEFQTKDDALTKSIDAMSMESLGVYMPSDPSDISPCYYKLTCKISIYNTSSRKTIKNVTVKLTNIDKYPKELKGKLPICLHFKDDVNYEKRNIDIHPNERKFVNVIMYYVSDMTMSLNSDFVICDTNNNIEDMSFPTGSYKLEIQASGENTPCKFRNFKIDFKNFEIQMHSA